jgi:hypothetical protein
MIMGKLGDWLDIWEPDMAKTLRRIVLPEGTQETAADADEVCFFGSVRTLPRSMEYLRSLGTPVITPEVYVVGIKDGKLIPPQIWFASPVRERLEAVQDKFSQEMTQLMEICDREGFTKPAAVKSAVIVSTGEAFTKYDFDPLPRPPYPEMSAADLAFDIWTYRIQRAGSAFRELKDAHDREMTE